MRQGINWKTNGFALVLLFCSMIYAQPQLTSPSNGAQNQPVTLTLSWNSVSGVYLYYISVSTSSDFSGTSVVLQTYSRSTRQAVVGLINSKTYFWSVSGNAPNHWANAWSFTTVALSPGTPIAPVLSSPSNTAAFETDRLTLKWLSVSNATSYGLQVSRDSTFVSFVYTECDLIRGGITSTYSTFPFVSRSSAKYLATTSLDGYNLFYWRVDASNEVGTGPWSNVWSFYVPNFDGILPIVKQNKSPPASNNFRVGITKLLAHTNVIEAYSLKGEKINPEFLSRIDRTVIYRYTPRSGYK
jgi:hypothetical protein